MNRRRAGGPASTLCLLLAGCAGGGRGVTAAPFAVPNLEGAGQVSLQAERGHPVVVNFFASWCPPCQAELPLLAAAARAHPTVRFLGIDVNDTAAPALAMLSRFGVHYPAGADRDGTLAHRYGLPGLPGTLFISASGDLATRVVGQLTAASLAHGIALITAPGRP